MKKITLSLLAFIAIISNAANFVVQQNGPVGTYSTIASAITAASDGDQIIINNRTDLLPWQENITVNKSLTFLSAIDNVKFNVLGTWTIDRANNRTVNINGMNNVATLTNIVVSNIGSGFSSRTKLNIVNSDLLGVITSTVSFTDLYLGSCNTRSIFFTYGKIIGNEITGAVRLDSDFIVNNDTILIVGNIIKHTTNSSTLYLNSSSQMLMVYNNWVQGFGTGWGLYLNSLKNSSNINLFINNTFTTSSGYACEVNLPNTSINFMFVNNVFLGTIINSGLINLANPSAYQSNFQYNITEDNSLNISLFNISQTNLTLNSDGSNAFATATNAGNPSNEYLDLNLSRNDMGCYGGSYSFTNFHPILDGKSSRVNFVKTPRLVNQGNTFKAQAIGIDK